MLKQNLHSKDWIRDLGKGYFFGGGVVVLFEERVSQDIKNSPPGKQYYNVPLTKNIRYNAQLRKKIDELMKKVEVEQKEINKEK